MKLNKTKTNKYMKKLIVVALPLLVAAFLIAGCKDKNKNNVGDGIDSTDVELMVSDSTVYGVCGENTAMHSLELITDAGDTLHFVLNEDENGDVNVLGGLLAGDRLAVVEGPEVDGEKLAKKVINITTLLGKWTSLDKNFEIQDDGTVRSTVQAEKNPWTSWKIVNGRLVLNRDTFDINNLGSDSLYLENKNGIFVYKRAQ
jgi:putative lipoprotein